MEGGKTGGSGGRMAMATTSVAGGPVILLLSNLTRSHSRSGFLSSERTRSGSLKEHGNG